MYGVAIRLGLVAAAAVLAGCLPRRETDPQPVSNDPTFTPDPPDTGTPPTDTDDTGDPITSQSYSDVQSTYDQDLDGYLTEANATQLQQAIDDGYVTVDETGEAALALIEQGKYDCNDSPLTGFYTFPSAKQRLTMNQINDCDASDIEIELGEDAMTLSGTANYTSGDINGDGDLDIILAGSLDSNKGLYVFTNPSDVFGPGKSFDEASATYTVAEGESVGYPQIKDITGDGQPDLVFVSYLVSGGGLFMIPGPITSSLTLTSSDFADSAAVAEAGYSVIAGKVGAFFLTSDMDGYEPEVGEVVMWNGTNAINVFPALFEPGIHEYEQYYTFEGPLYDNLGYVDPVAGDVDGYEEEDGSTFVDLLVGDINYNYAALIRGGSWLQNYIGQTIEVDDPDTAAYHQEENIHLEETIIPFNRFTGNIDEGAYGAGASLGMGDVDGDGLADFSIGVIAEDANGYDDAGCGYTIFAEGYNNGPFPSGESIVLNGDVFSIGAVSTCGVEENMGTSASLSIASDLNGDGLKDSVLSAFLSEASTGKSFAQDAWTLIENAENRIRVDTAEHEVLGPTGVRTGGIDFDNDGFEDVVVNDADGTDYILFGGPSE